MFTYDVLDILSFIIICRQFLTDRLFFKIYFNSLINF